MDRRNLMKHGASALIFTRMVWPRFADADETANIIWDVPRSQEQTLKDALDFKGQITPQSSRLDTRAPPLFLIFAGAVAISALARALLAVYKDMRYGGIIITAHDGQLNIKNDVRLNSGTIIVYNSENIMVYQLNQEADQDVGPLVKSLNDIASSKPKP